MNSLTKPEMMLAATDFLLIVGGGLYLNRRIIEVEDAVKALTGHLKNTVGKGDENADKIDKLIKVVTELKGAYEQNNKEMREFIEETQEKQEEQDEKIDAIIEAMEDGGMTVDIPSENNKKKKKRRPHTGNSIRNSESRSYNNKDTFSAQDLSTKVMSSARNAKRDAN